MLFDIPHILFMVFASLGLSVTLVLCRLLIKEGNKKNLILKIAAILTIIIHYSTLYVDYFTTGSAEISSTMILPIYPCNIAMWLLLIVAFYKNKNSRAFNILATITFYLGLVGGILGIALNEIYAGNPNLADWDVLNGLLSHVTLLLGCIYILVGGYIKIRVFNLSSIIIGLIGLIVDGYIVIGLFKLFNLDPPNTMFLLEPPISSMPWFNTYLIGVLALVLFFITTVIVEQLTVTKEERWYNKLKFRGKN